jgi:hypothetical protein
VKRFQSVERAASVSLAGLEARQQDAGGTFGSALIFTGAASVLRGGASFKNKSGGHLTAASCC